MIIEIHEDEREALQKIIREASWGRADASAAPNLAEFARLDEHEEKAISALLDRLYRLRPTVSTAIDRAVEEIIADIRDRRGLKHEWAQIDSDVRDETRKAWSGIIAKHVPSNVNQSIRGMQDSLPWGLHKYSATFLNNNATHRDFAHAFLHVQKAMGHIARAIDDADHDDASFTKNEKCIERYLADLVICTLRMANTCPAGRIDIQDAIEARWREKFDDEIVANALKLNAPEAT